MQLQKRTYSIDQGILAAFENAVASGNRSIVIGRLLKEYLAEKEREEIRRNLIEGAPLVNDEYREESRLWYPLEEEVYAKANSASTPARGRNSRPTRSGKGPRASGDKAGARSLARIDKQ